MHAEPSVIKRRLFEHHMEQPELSSTKSSTNELDNMHPLCSLNHDQYSTRLTLSTSKDFSFAHMNEQQVKFIAGYFTLPYLSNTSQIMSKMNLESNKASVLAINDFNTTNIILIKSPL